ncbi:MAG: ABC transporter substrate-binding protein [Clostridia bacterium]|nr:ABC transporter substrate-binding protein [Clostridia bacterium]
MRRKIPIVFLLALLACVCMTMTACKPNEEKGVIRLNEVTHSIFYAPQYVAMSLGYFEEAGITIELTNGGGADKVMTALLTDAADVGLMGPEACIYVYNEGRNDYPVVFGQLTKRDGSFLIGRTDEDFDWSVLEGKEIIMGRRGGVPAMTLQYVLNQKGYFDGENITMNYSVQFNMLAPAFSSGTGDYVPLFEPTATQVVLEKIGYNLCSIGTESGEIPYTAYIATQSYINENADMLEKFLDCIYRANQYIKNNDYNQTAALIASHFDGTTVEDIAVALKSYTEIDAWMTTPSMTEESFIRLQDIMINAGELTEYAPFDKLIYNKIADKIGK